MCTISFTMKFMLITYLSVCSLIQSFSDAKVILISEDTSTTLSNGFDKEFDVSRSSYNYFPPVEDVKNNFNKMFHFDKKFSLNQKKNKNILIIKNDEMKNNDIEAFENLSMKNVVRKALVKNQIQEIILNYLQNMVYKQKQELLDIEKNFEFGMLQP